MTTSIPVLIVGAGPAGLAVAGRLRKLDIPFEIVEKTNKIAWSWHNHYDRLCLHTVKQLSALPHLPFPEDYPLYVPRLDLVAYYEQYAQHFNITPHFNTAVTQIQKAANQKWLINTNTDNSFQAAHVVIATGVNRVPYHPTWQGQENFRGTITHSKAYKNPTPFKNSKVLIIGMGNTGAEIALDLSEHGVETYISVRSPVNVVPRDVNGRPVQLTSRQLAKLPWGIGDWLGTVIRKRIIGDLTKYGIPMSDLHPAKQLQETGKTPVIDLGTVAHIKAGKIKILPDIAHFVAEGVITKDKQTHEFDHVILCTGYRAKIDEFIKKPTALLDQYQVPKQPIADDAQYKGLYFIGFDNYKLGGILGTIYNDSKTIADQIKHEAT